MTLIVCTLMLPLPVPMMHRHDEIDSHVDLACHLAERHHLSSCVTAVDDDAEGCCQGPTLHELHWHFVLQSQYRRNHESGHDVPPVESAFLASADSGTFAATITLDRLIELSASAAVAGVFVETLNTRFDIGIGCRQAADAFRVSRCALACVMRC